MKGETSMNTNELWNRIVSMEGETFLTVTGLPFTYKILNDNKLQPIRNGSRKWIVTKEMLEKANAMLGGSKTDFNKAIIAPSYIYGILTDRRITD